ncbi:hypothetical protein PROVRUST_07291 [Providencia rustigianii DSM 4541]|uniref:Uncharacterized protein n=1 Tax=Providencia rustigianii DSM 4541 TaxID=500637 RepID=D1P4Y7_9GAMM|nr:hypothetical protein PROVRUST_07291 [Providencia rustigianii DSM 4541]
MASKFTHPFKVHLIIILKIMFDHLLNKKAIHIEWLINYIMYF